MSFVHRILTGLEFALDADANAVRWPAQTEDLVRLSLELARVTRSGLAFAAVAQAPEEECDCEDIDRWLAEAEQHVEEMTRSSAIGAIPVEQAAWFGPPDEEWAASARESEMHLLIVPGATVPESPAESLRELEWPRQAGCAVWFAGREPDRLDAAPPLIAFCDDLSDEAAEHLPFAVELALAWNARLLIVHPLTQPAESVTRDEDDRLRREVFVRLSRTDFRSLPHGSQLRLLPGNLCDILAQISTDQPPNLLLASAQLALPARPPWRGHVVLW